MHADARNVRGRRTKRISIAERLGDMVTADHKVLDVE